MVALPLAHRLLSIEMHGLSKMADACPVCSKPERVVVCLTCTLVLVAWELSSTWIHRRPQEQMIPTTADLLLKLLGQRQWPMAINALLNQYSLLIYTTRQSAIAHLVEAVKACPN